MFAVIVQFRHRAYDRILTIIGKSRSSSPYAGLARQSAGTFLLQIAFTGLSFLTGILLARLLGTSGYGSYAYALTWANFLLGFVVLGFGQVLVRNVAAYQAKSTWNLMKGILSWTDRLVLAASLGLAVLTILVVWVFRTRIEPQVVFTLWVAMLLLPLMALLRQKQSILQGLGHVVVSRMADTLLQPMFFLLGVGSLYFLLGNTVTAPWAMGMNVLTAGIALLAVSHQLHRRLPQALLNTPASYQTQTWIRSALPLLLAGILAVVNSRSVVLILGALAGTEAVGIYNAAARGADLVSFVLAPVNVALGPTIASLYAQGDKKQVQHVITRSARIILLLSLPIAVGLIVFGDKFLSLYGPGFAQGQTVLAILSVGLLINVAAGFGYLLLVMTGHELDALLCIGVSAILNVVLGPLLISKWGMEGAALTTAVNLVLWTIVLVVWVRVKVGIDPTALGAISWRRRA